MNFTKEEIEALMKYLGGGAVINLTDCQIVLGDNAKLGDICERRSMLMLRQLQTSRLLIRNSRRRKPKPFSEN